ncbi:MAG TPA: hypothetical protein VM452_12090 [Caulifigura sp.]|jgi:hypothetical protein|nr:hypothetical protein [Caulifigura sp.]
MSDAATANEIQLRIETLKAELENLSMKVSSVQATDANPEPPAATAERRKSPPEPATSIRRLRDLLWQGRWSLAFHLARALEQQQSIEPDFPPDLIRAWALASRFERQEDAASLIADLIAPSTGPESLGQRMLKWASLITFVRSIDPACVQASVAGFIVPEELPVTAGWWQDYIHTLASTPREAAYWKTIPDAEPVGVELNDLLLHSDQEPTRLAASCLMMSVRNAMRQVQTACAAGSRFILNAELARSTGLAIGTAGDVDASPAEVEQAICQLPAEAVKPMILERPKKESAAPNQAAITLAVQDHAETVPPSEAKTLKRNALARPTAAADESRRDAARERLKLYAARLAARRTTPATIPFNTVLINQSEFDVAGAPSLAEIAGPAFTADRTADREAHDPRPAPQPVHSPVSKSAEATSAAAGVERRGIHEVAVASAFGGDVPHGNARAALSTGRPQDRQSIWGVLFNPTTAIIAGLLIIASAVALGLSTGLRATHAAGAVPPAEAAPNKAAPAEYAGDFQAAQ